MSCIKAYIEDVCYDFKGGLSVPEIAKKRNTTPEMILRILTSYYKAFA